jgi:CheY-like chemotaxis protein
MLPNTSVHILVVDDDPIARMVHQKILEHVGYAVVLAENGREAVELSKKQHFDVICMDINMPEMDGLEATTIIRSQEDSKQPTYIIGVTSSSKDKQKDCLIKGMNTVLSKPVIAGELINIVQQAILVT